MFDINTCMLPYHDSKCPEEDIKCLTSKVGFRYVEVHCKDSEYVFEGIEVLKQSFRAVNPFLHRMIPTLGMQFIEEFIEELMQAEDVKKMTNSNDNCAPIKTYYNLIVAYAVK